MLLELLKRQTVIMGSYGHMNLLIISLRPALLWLADPITVNIGGIDLAHEILIHTCMSL